MKYHYMIFLEIIGRLSLVILTLFLTSRIKAEDNIAYVAEVILISSLIGAWIVSPMFNFVLEVLKQKEREDE